MKNVLSFGFGLAILGCGGNTGDASPDSGSDVGTASGGAESGGGDSSGAGSSGAGSSGADPGDADSSGAPGGSTGETGGPHEVTDCKDLPEVGAWQETTAPELQTLIDA